MLKTMMVATRDRARLAQISQITTRYGLDLMLARLGLGKVEGNSSDTSKSGSNLPQKTRKAIEELGPTFVKFGQILATRRDLLPPEWIEELEHLQSQAPTLDFEELRKQVEETLGKPPEMAFASFDTQPLAAASMAQVHRATLHDGTQVAVKIRRPGILPKMEADLRLIRHFASIAESANKELRRLKVTTLIDQLARDVMEEVDFTIEGRNADRLRSDLDGNDRVVVPQIYWDFSSESLLVMDYVEGIEPKSAASLKEAGLDPGSIAELGADMVLDMVLINGRFHGDPHPGNLLCLAGNRLALLDLGLVGSVSPRRQQEILSFLLSLRNADSSSLTDVLLLWSQEANLPRDRILAAAERLVSRHSSGALQLDALMADFFPLLREEGLILPADLLLIFKALITMDGVLNAIAPGFDLSKAIQRSRAKLLLNQVARIQNGDRLEMLFLELAKISDDAPRLMRALTKRIEEEPTGPSYNSKALLEVALAGKYIASAILAGSILVTLAILAL